MEISKLDKAYVYLELIQQKYQLLNEWRPFLNKEQLKYVRHLIKIENQLKLLIRKLLNGKS